MIDLDRLERRLMTALELGEIDDAEARLEFRRAEEENEMERTNENRWV